MIWFLGHHLNIYSCFYVNVNLKLSKQGFDMARQLIVQTAFVEVSIFLHEPMGSGSQSSMVPAPGYLNLHSLRAPSLMCT